MQRRYAEKPIIGFLREADAGLPVKKLCRKKGLSEPNFYAWKATFGGINVSDVQRLKARQAGNEELKKLTYGPFKPCGVEDGVRRSLVNPGLNAGCRSKARLRSRVSLFTDRRSEPEAGSIRSDIAGVGP